MKWADGRVHKEKYSLLSTKYSSGKSVCSTFVYKGYIKQGADIDNGSRWFVLPSDLKKDSDTRLYNAASKER
jgi:hypothetical protein